MTFTVDTDVRVPMRDGTSLGATILRPAGPGRHPVVLMRTPYDRRSYASGSLQVHTLALAEAGYAVMLQDVRGRGDSDGVFTPFVNERDDGLDTLAWLDGRPWCDGNVALAGISYNAFSQTALVSATTAMVRCWAPGLGPADVRSTWIRRGGVVDLGFHLSWALGAIVGADAATEHADSVVRAFTDPVSTIRRGATNQPEIAASPTGTWFTDWVAHEDPYPGDRRVPDMAVIQEIGVPALVVAGWFDVFSSGSLELLEGLRSGATETTARLVAGPWDHGGLPLGRRSGDRDFGPGAAIDLHTVQIEWFDQHLRGGAEVTIDRVFITGADTWSQEPTWPPSTGEAVLMPGADGLLGPGAARTGVLSVEIHDDDPAPALGGAVFPWEPSLRPGVFDQRHRQSRDDVIAFAGSPLAKPLLVTGRPRLELRVETPVRGQPMLATLLEISSEGPVWNVADGMAVIQDVSDVTHLDLGPVAHEFAAGSAIGLELAFDAVPRLAPSHPGRRVIHLGDGSARFVLPVAG